MNAAIRARNPIIKTNLVGLGLISAWALGAGGPMEVIAEDNAVLSFDLLGSLRIDKEDPEGGLDLDKLEPPGIEEYLNEVVELLEIKLSKELEYCQAAGFIPIKGESTGGRFDETVLKLLLGSAEKAGCSPRSRQHDRPNSFATAANKWRKSIDSIMDLAQLSPGEKEIKKLIDTNYDSDLLGPADAESLYRLRNRMGAEEELAEMIGAFFLAPVKGKVEDLEDVEDWRLTSRGSTKFGREIKIAGESRTIENIVKETILVGDDGTFDGVTTDEKRHSFEGFFLYSRQAVDQDDVTTTVVIESDGEVADLARKGHDLAADYARVRTFRMKAMQRTSLQYVDPEITAESLFPSAVELGAETEDADDRLSGMQQHFGAPVGRRSRTKDSKLIEWSGYFMGIDENMQARLSIDSGVEGQPLHTALVEASGSPLGEEAAYGKLKIGEEVFLVATVAKLAYAGSGDGTMIFSLSPAVEAERSKPGDRGKTSKTKAKGKKKKRSTRKRGAIRDKGVG